MHVFRTILKFALVAVLGFTTVGSLVVTQTTTKPASAAELIIRERFPAGYIDPAYHGGYWQGRRYAHRRWVAGYYGPMHHFHRGHWQYF